MFISFHFSYNSFYFILSKISLFKNDDCAFLRTNTKLLTTKLFIVQLLYYVPISDFTVNSILLNIYTKFVFVRNSIFTTTSQPTDKNSMLKLVQFKK